jgi:hypothetical protein
MAMQTDLFAGAPPPAPPLPPSPPPAAELLPPAPTLAWAKLLARSGVAHEVTVLVSWLWAEGLVESVTDTSGHRFLLQRDGEICLIAGDPRAPGRVVYLDPRQATELHQRHPLIRIGATGTHSAGYRFAQPGESAPKELDMPPGCDEP